MMPAFDPVAYVSQLPKETFVTVSVHNKRTPVSNIALFTEAQLTAAYEQGKLDAVPEGWVAIPIIPTDKQIRAMEDQWMRGSNIDMAMREYSSAIAAAPKQEN